MVDSNRFDSPIINPCVSDFKWLIKKNSFSQPTQGRSVNIWINLSFEKVNYGICCINVYKKGRPVQNSARPNCIAVR